jgi:hypothetical protein
MSAMTAATDVAPSSEQLFTRGGPNVPDNRGLSMVGGLGEALGAAGVQQRGDRGAAVAALPLVLPQPHSP